MERACGQAVNVNEHPFLDRDPFDGFHGRRLIVQRTRKGHQRLFDDTKVMVPLQIQVGVGVDEDPCELSSPGPGTDALTYAANDE